MEKIYYFAYGSNMNSKDLKKYCEEHNRKIELKNPEVVRLSGYDLKFTNYSGTRNSWVADVIKVDYDSDVWGVLFETDTYSLNDLDNKEGVKRGTYKRILVNVVNGENLIRDVITYDVVTKDTGCNNPSSQYLDIIIKGAEEHNLPTNYIAELKAKFR